MLIKVMPCIKSPFQDLKNGSIFLKDGCISLLAGMPTSNDYNFIAKGYLKSLHAASTICSIVSPCLYVICK
jgi:biotin synthase-related radical SAM superfamily protein